MAEHVDMSQMGVTSVASAGLGTITLGAAASGFRHLNQKYSSNQTIAGIKIKEGTAWEVATDCAFVYNANAALCTIGRGTFRDSSTGSAIVFTNAAIVDVVTTADMGRRWDLLQQGVTPGGRLTLESGVPISTTDQTAKTTIYYTPYLHDVIVLWDGINWVPVKFTQYTLALGTLTSGKPYDVFAYLSSGTLALEVLVWTNDTTRATAVTLQDGRYCKSGDKTRLLLGTFYTTSTTTTEDSKAKRFVANLYNRTGKVIEYKSGAASHAYSTSTRRAWNNDAASRLQFVCSIPTSVFSLMQCDITAAIASRGRIELELNGLTGETAAVAIAFTTSVAQQQCSATFFAESGYNFLHLTEISSGGASVTYDYLIANGSVQC